MSESQTQSEPESEIQRQSEKENENTRVDIEYGDIIEIIAPTNPFLHENSFFVNYVDEQKVKIINIATKEFILLKLNETTGFTDESITQVSLLDRSSVSGYARQKGLLPRVWVDVYFKGIPTITGEITNLEEDQIEITTYPDMKIFYIDFSYRGIPEDIPLEKFVIREKPRELERFSSLARLRETMAEQGAPVLEEEEDATQKFLPNGDSVVYLPENAQPDVNIAEVLRDENAKKRGIVYGEYLDKISQFVETRESERRYTIETQTNSLMDELLSTIPYLERTSTVMTNIHILIQRYTELREMYSVLDDNDNVRHLKKHDVTMHKPLVDHLQKMDVRLPWLLPVVSIKKKLYLLKDEDTGYDMPDADEISIIRTLAEEEEIKGIAYYKNHSDTEQNKYSTMHRQINDFLTPFDTPDDASSYLKTIPVRTRVETMVETMSMPSFQCPAYVQGNVSRTRFFQQVFEPAVTRLAGQNTQAAMMPADHMTVQSLIMLPESMIRYTRMFQQNASILDRANLHENRLYPFLFLNKKANIDTVTVDDDTREIAYEQNKESAKTKLNYLNSQAITRFQPAFESNDYKKYLYSVLPKTSTVLQWIRRELDTLHRYSMYEIVQMMEPFMIYASDVAYGHYNSIRFFIKEQHPLLIKVLADHVKMFRQYKNEQYPTEDLAPLLLQILSEKKDLATQFLTAYRLDESQLKQTTHELLTHVRNVDGGNVFVNILSSLMSMLVTPNPLVALESTPIETTNPIAEACNRRVLAKKYDSLVSLENDNGKDAVFFDKDLDDIPYDLLKPYEREQREMSDEKFMLYFAENLVQKHGIERENAEVFAQKIIAGKREVRDGEYALLEIAPKLRKNIDEGSLTSSEKEQVASEAEIRTQTAYYIRKKNLWIRDDSIEDIMFMENQTLFCNWSDLHKRNTNKKREQREQQETENQEKRRLMQQQDKERIRKEFDRRYDLNREAFQQMIVSETVKCIRRVFRLQVLRDIQARASNDLAYEIGAQYNLSHASDETGVVVCPYLELKRKILDQRDFVEKQAHIVRFVDEYCREPMVAELKEDPHWKYCKETNTKLMPAFLYTLAREFVVFGQEAYSVKLNQIIALQGYQEGNSIYDKHSDEWIKFIDNVEEEGYTEEGFRIKTHAVMEEDVETGLQRKLRSSKQQQQQQQIPLFENRTHQELHQIFSKFSEHLPKFDPETIHDIRRISFALSEKESIIMNKSMYEKEVQKQRAKGKSIMSYDDMRNRQMIVIVVSVMFTFMQTAIPSMKKNRTTGSCVFSLDGFPLTGEEDLQGVKYMACILKKLATDNAPWNTVYKKSESWLSQELVKMLKIVAAESRIELLYEKKREYLTKFPQEIIPEAYRVEKWQHFLPPIVRTDANKHVSSVSSGFIGDFWNMAQKGQLGQTEIVMTLRSKIANYGYSAIEFIQHVVKSKELLMKTMTNMPFMQNACCNDSMQYHPMQYHPIVYFSQQEGGQTLTNYIKIVVKLSAEVYRIKLLSDPRTLAYTMKRRVNTRLIVDDASLIYAAMIYYCRLDRGEIPIEFRGFFSEVPEGYNKHAELSSKIAFLQQQRKFNEKDLQKLMTIVRRKNKTDSSGAFPTEFVPFARFQNVLTTNHGLDPELVARLRRFLTAASTATTVRETQEPLDVIKEDASKEVRDFLYEKNRDLFAKIVQFMQDYGNLKETEMENITLFLARMDLWEIDEMDRVLHFLKNIVFDLTHYFPGILLNRSSTEKINFYPGDNEFNNHRMHGYWDLSMADKLSLYTFLSKQYMQLYSFSINVQDDESLRDLLMKLREPFVNIYMFVDELPRTAPFDKELLYMMSMYAIYSTFALYIDEVDPIQLRKKPNDMATETNEDEPSFEEEIDFNVRDEDEMRRMNENLAKLLVVLVNVHGNNKKYLNYSYLNVEREVVKNRESEKERIMKRLEEMEKPARNVENLAKKYKLGMWSVGQQKGIYMYDKKTSDREREENILQGISDLPYEIMGEEQQQPQQFDADEIDADQEAQWDREQEDEMNAFPTTEGYLDGAYYSDDEADQDFTEY